MQLESKHYHIYVDNVFIETIQSTQPMWVVMNQVTEIYSDYKTSLQLSMMGGAESVLYRFRSELS